MAKARVLGQNVELLFQSQQILLPVVLGEIDSFSARSTTTVTKNRPIGFTNERATPVYGGWELSFDGGKVDWALCHYYWLQEQRLRSGKNVAKFTITEKVTHYDGAKEEYTYKNVIIYGLDLSRSMDNVSERFSAFATHRTLGITDTTILSDPLGNIARELVSRANIDAMDKITNFLERPI